MAYQAAAIIPDPHLPGTFYIGGDTWQVGTRYRLVRLLGEGSFSSVAAAIDNETQEEVALKRIPNVLANAENAKRVLREVCILRRLRHPHVIALRDVFLKPSPTGRYTYRNGALVPSSLDLYLALEYAGQGDLFHMRGQLSEQEVKAVMLQLLSAVGYLHSNGVWHRDIKSANILMTYRGGARHIKLADLGSARSVLLEQQLSELDMMQPEAAAGGGGGGSNGGGARPPGTLPPPSAPAYGPGGLVSHGTQTTGGAADGGGGGSQQTSGNGGGGSQQTSGNGGGGSGGAGAQQQHHRAGSHDSMASDSSGGGGGRQQQQQQQPPGGNQQQHVHQQQQQQQQQQRARQRARLPPAAAASGVLPHTDSFSLGAPGGGGSRDAREDLYARPAPGGGAGFKAPLTRVVCTPCYRAPEVVMSRGGYTSAIDMWGCGCVFGELLQRVAWLGKATTPQLQVAPVFAITGGMPETPASGETYADAARGGGCGGGGNGGGSGGGAASSLARVELAALFQVIGTPSWRCVECIESPAWRRYLRRMPVRAPTLFRRFGSAGEVAVDLLARLLSFDPARRCGCEEALGHEYFEDVLLDSGNVSGDIGGALGGGGGHGTSSGGWGLRQMLLRRASASGGGGDAEEEHDADADADDDVNDGDDDEAGAGATAGARGGDAMDEDDAGGAVAGAAAAAAAAAGPGGGGGGGAPCVLKRARSVTLDSPRSRGDGDGDGNGDDGGAGGMEVDRFAAAAGDTAAAAGAAPGAGSAALPPKPPPKQPPPPPPPAAGAGAGSWPSARDLATASSFKLVGPAPGFGGGAPRHQGLVGPHHYYDIDDPAAALAALEADMAALMTRAEAAAERDAPGGPPPQAPQPLRELLEREVDEHRAHLERRRASGASAANLADAGNGMPALSAAAAAAAARDASTAGGNGSGRQRNAAGGSAGGGIGAGAGAPAGAPKSPHPPHSPLRLAGAAGRRSAAAAAAAAGPGGASGGGGGGAIARQWQHLQPDPGTAMDAATIGFQRLPHHADAEQARLEPEQHLRAGRHGEWVPESLQAGTRGGNVWGVSLGDEAANPELAEIIRSQHKR